MGTETKPGPLQMQHVLFARQSPFLRTCREFQGFCACECPHLFAVGALVAPTVAKSACISCTKRKIKKGTNSTLVVHCTHDGLSGLT